MGGLLGGLRGLAARLRGRKPTAPAPPAATGPRYSAVGSDPIGAPAGMVGREAETRQVEAALAEHRLLLVHGQARIGKTHLCQRVAAQWKEKGRPFWYACPSDRGIGELYERLGRFLAANGQKEAGEELTRPEANDDDRAAGLAEVLQSQPILVVLDRFEAVADRGPFRALGRAAAGREGPGRLVLVSRSAPDWWAGLPASQAAAFEVPPLCPGDTCALAARMGCPAQDLAALAQRGAIHPFGLQLVLKVARLRKVTPGQVLASVPPERLERALVTLIYKGLAGRDIVDRLSILRLPWAPEAIGAFGGPEGFAAQEDVALLLEAVSGGRQQLHPVVAEYARQRLGREPGMEARAHEQAIAYYQGQLGRTRRWQALTCGELAHHLLAAGRPAEALRVVSAEVRTIVSFGLGWVALHLAEQIEATGLLEQSGPEEEALHRRELAAVYEHLPVGNVDALHLKAIRYCGRALEVHRSLGRRLETAQSLNLLGMSLTDLPSGDVRKNVHRALESFQEAIGLYHEMGLTDGRMVVHNNTAVAWLRLSQVGGEECERRAVAHLRQAARLFGQSTDPYTQALVSRNLGGALCQRGDVEEGMTHFGAALKHFTLEDYPREYGQTQKEMGDAHRLLMTGRRTFRLKQAMTYYGEAARVHEEEIFPEDFAQTQLGLAIAHRQMAIHEGPVPHHELSVKCYQNALRVYTEAGFPRYHRMIAAILRKDGVEEEEDDTEVVETDGGGEDDVGPEPPESGGG